MHVAFTRISLLLDCSEQFQMYFLVSVHDQNSLTHFATNGHLFHWDPSATCARCALYQIRAQLVVCM